MKKSQTDEPDVIVIGGGAAGLMAAGVAAHRGRSVLLLERGARLGRKLAITGKGRCNVLNDCSADEVMKNVPVGSRFLHSALSGFGPADAMRFFEELGVPLKTERGNRVFPVSDRAGDVVSALERYAEKGGVRIVCARAAELLTEDGAIAGVRCEDGSQYRAKSVILATGGVSYPLTGSTGDGYRMAAGLGHTVVAPKPSLVPLVESGRWCARMQGLALKNVGVKVWGAKKKPVYEDFGELLFTHFGLSGPTILSASAHMRDYEKNQYRVVIDLKPALDEQKLDARLLREFQQAQNRDFANSLGELFPRLMIPVIIERSGIEPTEKVNAVTREQRRHLLELIKAFSIDISGPRPVDEAIVTSGGIKTAEIDPSTMESKLTRGLYFAGEVIDVDAYTGGFNLQIAWSTAYAAGNSAGNTPADVVY